MSETISKLPLFCQTSKGNNAIRYGVFFVFNRFLLAMTWSLKRLSEASVSRIGEAIGEVAPERRLQQRTELHTTRGGRANESCDKKQGA
jgi:hypothetical protein